MSDSTKYPIPCIWKGKSRGGLHINLFAVSQDRKWVYYTWNNASPSVWMTCFDLTSKATRDWLDFPGVNVLLKPKEVRIWDKILLFYCLEQLLGKDRLREIKAILKVIKKL